LRILSTLKKEGGKKKGEEEKKCKGRRQELVDIYNQIEHSRRKGEGRREGRENGKEREATIRRSKPSPVFYCRRLGKSEKEKQGQYEIGGQKFTISREYAVLSWAGAMQRREGRREGGERKIHSPRVRFSCGAASFHAMQRREEE